MAGRFGSLSRSVISTARTSTLRSSPAASLLRSPPPIGRSLLSRRLLPGLLQRNNGVLGCAQSLLPVYSARLTSHIDVDARSCCELSQGT